MAEFGNVEPRGANYAAQGSVVSPELLTGPSRRTEQAGNALLKAGSAVTDIGLHIQAQEDATKVLAAETALKTRFMDFHTEAKGRLGGNAWGLRAETDKWFNDQHKELGAELKTERQQRMFKQSFDKTRLNGVDWASTHELGQRQRFTEETARASITGSVRIAAANPYNPIILDGAKDDIKARVETVSRLNGWDPVKRDGEFSEHMTNLHTQVIQNMLAEKDSKGAKEYYEHNKREIDATKRDGLIKQLEIGAAVNVAQKFATDVQTRKLSEAEALAEARSKLEGDEQVRAVSEIKQRYGEVDTQRNRDQAKAKEEMIAIYNRTGNPNDIPPELISRVDPADYLALRNTHETKLDRQRQRREHDERMRERAANTSDKTVLHDLFALSATPAFATYPLDRHEKQLSSGDYKYFLAHQVAMKTKPEKVIEARIDNDRFNGHAEAAGLRPFDPKKSEEEKAHLGRLRREVEEHIEIAQRGKKDPLTAEDKDKIAARVVNAKVIKERRMWIDAAPVPSAVIPKDVPEEKLLVPITHRGREMTIRLSDIKEADRNRIKAKFYQRTGYLPTIKEIAEAWQIEKDRGTTPAAITPTSNVIRKPIERRQYGE